MTKYIFILLSIFSASIFLYTGCGSSSRLDSNQPISKEVSCITSENTGGLTYKLLAWGIGGNNEEAEIDAMKAAVYAILVGGVSGGGCSGTSIISSTDKDTDFLEKFFAYENQWRQYVADVNNGLVRSDRRIKLSDGNVKIGLEVVVKFQALKDDLNAKGVIKNDLQHNK